MQKTSNHVMAVLLCLSWAFGAAVDTAAGQIVVGSWNIAQLRGDFDSIEHVLAEASADPYPGFTAPVTVWVFQEVDTDNVEDLHSLLGPQYSLGTYTSSNEDTYSGAQAMFYRADMVAEVVSGHDDIYTGAGRRSDRWQVRLLGSSPVCDFYIYSSHLKASTGSANQEDRRQGIEWLLDNTDEIPAGSCIIFAGDYNIYTNSEPAYELLVTEAVDPYGNGSWSGDSNAYKHTQSPRASSGGGLIGGSLDDRFDFVVHNPAMQDGVGLEYIPGSLRPLGNDGDHYDEAINAGTNTYFDGSTTRSNQLADALHDASDHIPVLAAYTEPAILSSVLQPVFDPVIVGGSIDVLLTVDNAVDVPVDEAGAPLNWTATGSGALEGVSESGTVSSGASPSLVPLTISAEVAGVLDGQLTIDSPDLGTQQVPAVLATTGTVLRSSVPSFAPDNAENFRVFSYQFEADSGVRSIDVDLYNYGYDSLQATLDFDAIQSPAAPFAFTGAPSTGLGAGSLTLPFAFDTAGLSAGTYVENLAVSTSDEDLSGEQSSSIMLVMAIEIIEVSACEGDFSGDGRTDVQDLLFVIENWGSLYDIADLLLVISDWDCE